MSVSTQPGQIAFTWTFVRRELGGEGADEPEERRPSRRCSPCTRARRSARGSTRSRRRGAPPGPARGGAAPRARSSRCRRGSSGRGRRTGRRPRRPHRSRRRSRSTATSAWTARARRRWRSKAASTSSRSRMSQAATWLGAVDRRCGLLERASPQPDQADRGAVAGETDGDRPADPGACTRDDDVSGAHRLSDHSQFAAFPSSDALAERSRQSVDCRCAEHGTRVGRSSPGGPYAEAEGQSGKWTKAHPARRNLGPVLCRAHSVERKCVHGVKKSPQRAEFGFRTMLDGRPARP